MPLYEFECRKCMTRFEELVEPGTEQLPCPACGSTETRRHLSNVSPPNRQHRSPGKVRSSEGKRSEREAARRERLADAGKKRARGERP